MDFSTAKSGKICKKQLIFFETDTIIWMQDEERVQKEQQKKVEKVLDFQNKRDYNMDVR